MKENYILLAVLLITLIFATSCGKKLVNETIEPVNFNTSRYSDAGEKASYCTHDPGGSLDLPQQPKEVWVGYLRTYNPGTEPFPCWSWICAIYRGAFRFDLSPFKNKEIFTAVLHMSAGKAICQTGDTVSGIGVWVKEICRATTEWFKGPNLPTGIEPSVLFACEPIPGMPELPVGTKPEQSDSLPVKFKSNHYTIDVTQLVREWVKETKPNFGFVLKGANENIVEMSNGKALSPIRSIKLELSFFEPK